MPNDRFDENDSKVILLKPQLIILKDGNSIYKPGMKTFLADHRKNETDDEEIPEAQGIKGSKGAVVGGTICTCNTVCTCNTQQVPTCSCNTQATAGHYGCGYYCTCNPVH